MAERVRPRNKMFSFWQYISCNSVKICGTAFTSVSMLMAVIAFPILEPQGLPTQ